MIIILTCGLHRIGDAKLKINNCMGLRVEKSAKNDEYHIGKTLTVYFDKDAQWDAVINSYAKTADFTIHCQKTPQGNFYTLVEINNVQRELL